jgi:hypothetical protein
VETVIQQITIIIIFKIPVVLNEGSRQSGPKPIFWANFGLCPVPTTPTTKPWIKSQIFISLNHQDVINVSNKLDFADYYQHCRSCEAISLLE